MFNFLKRFHKRPVAEAVAPRRNILRSVCLRPKEDDESQAAFWPLFEQRNAYLHEQSAAAEKMFAAARANNMDEHAAQTAQYAFFEEKINELNAAMRPFQFEAWRREDANVVTNVGRNDILDKYWRGSSYTQTVVMGLAGAGTKAAGDTQASHAGWSEVGGANAPTYTGARKAVTMGAASSQSSVSPQQTFAITSTGTVAGLFMNNGGSATKDDTTGILTSVVNFTGGDEAVNNGDSLLVTYTFNG
jgi:hypothetical protein